VAERGFVSRKLLLFKGSLLVTVLRSTVQAIASLLGQVFEIERTHTNSALDH